MYPCRKVHVLCGSYRKEMSVLQYMLTTGYRISLRLCVASERPPPMWILQASKRKAVERPITASLPVFFSCEHGLPPSHHQSLISYCLKTDCQCPIHAYHDCPSTMSMRFLGYISPKGFSLSSTLTILVNSEQLLDCKHDRR